MPKVYSEGENYTKVLPGSSGVGSVPKGSSGKAKTPASSGRKSMNVQGMCDSRPADSDRTQSAK
jgi:hypothetical protein